MIMGIDIQTIILHCKRLTDRKQNMLDQLSKFGFSNYSFYEDYDANELTDHFVKCHYISGMEDPNEWSEKVGLWGTAALGYHPKKCNPAEISLTIKFGKVFQQLSKIDAEMFILFEDDVILCDEFDTRFYDYLSQTPNDWDAIYFGSGANLKPSDINANQIAYLKSHPASRCADSIVFKKKTIVDLASTWFPFNLISDWELGHQHFKHNHKVYWWEPSLVKQGSECGLYRSTLR
jgi:hypothetical protein